MPIPLQKAAPKRKGAVPPPPNMKMTRPSPESFKAKETEATKTKF